MNDYSATDRLLHRIALGSPMFMEFTFDLERIIFKPSAAPNHAVFITGLARAGTTVLMRALHESGQFASLTYDDMPFVLAPNLWGKFSRLNQKERAAKERAHGDGIKVDYDSPEALEEVFWRLQLGDKFSTAPALTIQDVSDETLQRFRQYQHLVCSKYGRNRYLAKNNNQVLRIANLAPRCPESVFLVVFREPLTQAESLQRQHMNFAAVDKFAQAYMTWLAHHEFGVTHRPIRLSNRPINNPDTGKLGYWVLQWVEVYEYLLGVLDAGHPNIVAVSHERLCREPAYWHALCDKIGIPHTPSPFRMIPRREIHTSVEISLLDHANDLYNALDQRAIREGASHT